MNWDLTKMYSGFDEAFDADMKKVRAEIASAAEQVKGLDGGDEVRKLRDMLEKLQGIADTLGKLGNMVMLTLAADCSCEAAMAPRAQLMDTEDEFNLLRSAFTCWVGKNSSRIDEFCAGDALINEHRLLLMNMADAAAHLIDPELEPVVLKMQQSGGTSWCQLHDELFAGLSIDVTIGGETKRLPLPAVRALAEDADPEVRRIAYEAEIAAYPRMETGMAACLNGIEGEALTLAKLRNFESVLDWSLDISRMDRATFDALFDAMKASLPMFRRYLRLKNRLLGGEGGIRFYDLFAPVGGSAKTYTLDEARDILLKVFGGCYAPIADVMRRAFDEKWIDAYPREGKAGGAFCSGVHALKQSYVLTNFGGSYGAVSTLAHELGHAYHDSRMNDVSALLCDIPMPLAETASTFNELLLSEYMMKDADRGTAMALLDQQLSDAAQVIVDIMSRFLFEREVIERRKTSTLSAKELCAIMLDAQKQTYGDGMDPECMHPYMWACKPHYYDTEFHFYNYPYAFGQLFAAGLYALYQVQGEAFWPVYDRLLQFSGSGAVRDVAASAGVDVTDPDFWKGSIHLFEEKLDRLEKLADQC